MTDEEKAEKYTKENYCNKCYLKDCSRRKNVSCYAMHYNDFLDGLAEGKPKWHDLRENPNDLPRGCEDCLCYISECYFVGHYVKEDKEWHFDEFESNEVIAWCEPPKFEE